MKIENQCVFAAVVALEGDVLTAMPLRENNPFTTTARAIVVER